MTQPSPWRRASAVLGYAVLLGGIAWSGGTVFLLTSAAFHEGTCRRPFEAYAVTWPVWYVLPTSSLVAVETWALARCDD